MDNANSRQKRSSGTQGKGKKVLCLPSPEIEKLKDKLISMQASLLKSKDLEIEILKKTNSIMWNIIKLSIRVQNIEQILQIKNGLKALESTKIDEKHEEQKIKKKQI